MGGKKLVALNLFVILQAESRAGSVQRAKPGERKSLAFRKCRAGSEQDLVAYASVSVYWNRVVSCPCIHAGWNCWM